VYFLLLPGKEWRTSKQLKGSNINLEIGFNFYCQALIEGLEHEKQRGLQPATYHEMVEWYDNRLFGGINPVDKSTEDGVGEEDTEADPNDLFFQSQEKEWEEECMLEVRLWLCGLNP